ncbi:MAG: hypothetical protein Q9183_003832 [Haloplaca sp. 2 TL-2023]
MKLSGLLTLLGWVATVSAQGNLGGDQSVSCTPEQRPGYIGCYGDQLNGGKAGFRFRLESNPSEWRSYPGYNGTESLSVDICITGCRGHGFKYAGLFSAIECWCSTELPYPNTPADQTSTGTLTYDGANPGTQSPGSNCNQLCPANPNQICGGYGHMSVYRDPTYVNETSPATIGVASNYGYFGCYSNFGVGPIFIDIKTANTINCQNYCGKLGYAYSFRGDSDLGTGFSCGCSPAIKGGYQIEESQCSRYCDGRNGAT